MRSLKMIPGDVVVALKEGSSHRNQQEISKLFSSDVFSLNFSLARIYDPKRCHNLFQGKVSQIIT